MWDIDSSELRPPDGLGGKLPKEIGTYTAEVIYSKAAFPVSISAPINIKNALGNWRGTVDEIDGDIVKGYVTNEATGVVIPVMFTMLENDTVDIERTFVVE